MIVRLTGKGAIGKFEIPYELWKVAVNAVRRSEDSEPLVLYNDNPICLPRETLIAFAHSLLDWLRQYNTEQLKDPSIVEITKLAVFALGAWDSVSVSAPLESEPAL